MIPVQKQPEPENFDQNVRQPGMAFLAGASEPINWRNHEYWQRALPALRHAYGGYCAYLAMRIPPAVGNPTVDHFWPKQQYPQMAYAWSNFRLASALINSRKGNAVDLVDPFELPSGWFVLEIPAMLTRPALTLDEQDHRRVERTIQVLKLNHLDVRQSRKAWVSYFALGKITFDFLADEQPFIAQELLRQGLVDTSKLASMFMF